MFFYNPILADPQIILTCISGYNDVASTTASLMPGFLSGQIFQCVSANVPFYEMAAAEYYLSPVLKIQTGWY